MGLCTKPSHLESFNWWRKKEAKDSCHFLRVLCLCFIIQSASAVMMFHTSLILCHVVFFIVVYLNCDAFIQAATVCQEEYSSLAARLPTAELLNLEAIRTLHNKLDKDASGTIELFESEKVREYSIN